MQFSLKSSLCRFIRKSFVGIFKMNTDSCFRHPRDGTSCHRTLEDLASWTRRPRFSGRRPQDCNCCRVTQYRRVGVLHQVTQGFCSPPQLLSPLLSDLPPQLATPSSSQDGGPPQYSARSGRGVQPGVEHWISRSTKEIYISNEYPLLGMLF